MGSFRRHFQTLVHKLEMNVQFPLCDLPRMAKPWLQVAGLAPSNYGTSQPVRSSVLFGVSLAISFGGHSSFFLLGHSDRVGGVAWHPQATLSQSVDSVNLVSGAGDACVNVWSLNRCVHLVASVRFICSPLSRSETPIAVMKGHQDRICRVAFHPSGNYVASASFDTTWRLWDINTSKEILLQEGHSREVYAVEFQDDGALAASAYVIFYSS
jgi:WD40 repeat protein